MTEWPDLVGTYNLDFFTQVAEQIGNKEDENLAALRTAVFFCNSRKPEGVVISSAGQGIGSSRRIMYVCWQYKHTRVILKSECLVYF